MRSGRLLKVINLSIAVLLAVAIAAVVWYLWRPLPRTSGTLQANVSAAARIVRDRTGVPHIFAATVDDALFLQGYVTAQDRMWQLDSLRRFGSGELSEVAGRGTLELDQEARKLRLRRIAEEQARRLEPADRAALAAYARGVNFYIEENRGRYPAEFTVLGYEPRPWTIEDSVVCGLNMFRDMTATWKSDIVKAKMYASGDRAKVEFLYPVRTGADMQPGSNAWVVAGSRTASGKPILANDPHLEFTLPATWYMVHLQAPGLNVRGASLPGLPGIIIGHNERIAWGVTNLHFDVQDLYHEQIAPNGAYLFRGQADMARFEAGMIAVKGEAPVKTGAWVTRHGGTLELAKGEFFALQWTAALSGGFSYPFVDLNRARNWQEFNAALARFPGPAQNFVYADVDGNIGYHAAGRLPVRKGFSGDVPVEGASGNFEWEAMIPYDELPSFYNPQGGVIVTANQNPFPADYRYTVSGQFAAPYRARQIRSILESRSGWKPEEMLAVQKDVYSAFSHFLAGQTVAAFDRTKPAGGQLAEAAVVLRAWNGQMDKDAAAPLVADRLFAELRTRIGERAAPGSAGAYTTQLASIVVERLLRERPADWFPDYDKLLIDSLGAALAEVTKTQGSKVANWRWGTYNRLTIVSPILGRIPWIGGYFNIGPVPMSGSSTTVKQTTQRLGPSMRMVVDLSNLDGSLQNITIGQSGHYLSRHYKDEWNNYWSGTSLPMQFGQVKAESELTVEPLR